MTYKKLGKQKNILKNLIATQKHLVTIIAQTYIYISYQIHLKRLF